MLIFHVPDKKSNEITKIWNYFWKYLGLGAKYQEEDFLEIFFAVQASPLNTHSCFVIVT